MDDTLGPKALALEPLDPPSTGGESTRASPSPSAVAAERRRELRITSSDDCLARAASEYQAGHIDQPLWDRTAAQTGNDEALAVAAYLRARATALRLKIRDEREEKRLAAGPMPGEPKPEVAPPPDEPAKPATIAPAKPTSDRRRVKYAVGALSIALAAGVAWLVAAPGESAPVPAPSAVVPVAPKEKVALPASSPPVEAVPDPSLQMKVQQLKAAGNWNVLVLYASEWTRKEPTNALAWTELSIGYTRMRQWGDALESATKAVNLSPGDSLHWRNLGQLNLVLERLPDAQVAYEKALAVDPENPEALCGATMIAKRQGRAKDAEGFSARLKSTSAGSCGDAGEGAELAAVARAAPTRKSTPSGVR